MNKNDFKAKLAKIEKLYRLEVLRPVNSEREYDERYSEILDMVRIAKKFAENLDDISCEFRSRHKEHDPWKDIPF